ncbi:MAG: M1 family metallopeptidase [Candidatus Obscuribacterales bacterium]|nr:M1 family metallopeptidase [Steroidobacteraceae bacterium]
MSKKSYRFVLVAITLLLVTRIVSAAESPTSDRHSFSNPHEVRVTHVGLDLRVDFDSKKLIGHVDLRLDRVNPAATELILDTRELTVFKVELTGRVQQELVFKFGDTNAVLGTPLRITLPTALRADRFSLRVSYETSPQASGLQWLSPTQTAGKKQPFLYSQSQAIHARSWVPLQDTPQVRFTYEARIRTPAHLIALMSADNDPQMVRDGDYSFQMPQAIPSYLLALSVGDVVFKRIGGRTGVYAEAPIVDAAAFEFADVQSMLEASEKLFGPYRWGRYDLLILPPSFMWGGMENPRLSFITPTVIAGDRSLVSLIAHELAHSWSGNLVTNASWESVWLNEGFTTYLERRIIAAIYGDDRRAMEDTLGMQSLKEDIDQLTGKGDKELTKLNVDLRNRDPDDAFSRVPYEKGRLFLGFLESQLGRDKLDAFLREYFAEFAFQSVSTEQFVDYLEAKVLKQPVAPLTLAEVAAWIDQPGLPATAVLPKSDAFKIVDVQRDAWLKGTKTGKQLSTTDWTTHQWLHFIKNLPADIVAARLGELDDAFKFTASRNNAIAHSWLKVAIRARYTAAYARLDNYLTSIGRRSLVKDLYEELLKYPEGIKLAREIYIKARPLYQVPLVEQLDKLLKVPRQ